MNYFNDHKNGLIGTIIFHIIVFFLLLMFGFFTPLPLPEEQGILVNFGTEENGLGEEEPAPSKEQAKPVEPVREDKVIPPPPVKQPVTQPKTQDDGVTTQDFEEAAAMKTADKKKKEEEKKKLKEREDEQRIINEKERIRLAEIEKKRIEDAERRRIEDAERKKKEEEQRRIIDINSRAKGAFGSGGTGTGGAGTSNSSGQGATFPGGNQGDPTGDPNAGNYGNGGKGTGTQGAGISYNLSGRLAKSLPKPKYPDDDEGAVVVKVTVDKNGNVTSAEPGQKGTTIMNQAFWNEAKQAALKAKFNMDDNAPAFQTGTITYKFTLD